MYRLFYERRVRNFDKFCAILVPPEDMGGSEISAYVLQADDGKGKDLWVIEQPDFVTENLQSIRTLSARNVWRVREWDGRGEAPPLYRPRGYVKLPRIWF